ncbi:MAG: protein kinase, partial [Betaproteobacteria bacterium]|nr:protein kinase [Betaproteobacteria bacterium]
METAMTAMDECRCIQIVPERDECPEMDIAFVSVKGQGLVNEDYVGLVEGALGERPTKGSALVIADGMSGANGGRIAAELSVRSFLEGYYQLPDTLGPEVAASKALDAIHRWLHQIGRADAALAQMAASFAALILRGQTGYLISAGDVRLYLLREGIFTQLSEDDILRVTFGAFIDQAVGLQSSLIGKFQAFELLVGDRLLLCTDGLYRSLSAKKIRKALSSDASIRTVADDLVQQARNAGSGDDITLAIVQLKRLPALDLDYLERVVGSLPIAAVPSVGDIVDGYALTGMLSDGYYSRLFIASDQLHPEERLVIKFPKPRVMNDANMRQALLRERWLSGKIDMPGIVSPVALDAQRQTRLYVVFPLMDGMTLEALIKRGPVSLSKGLKIAQRLGLALHGLNKRNIYHRDVKPENILIQKNGELKLLDLGFAYMPGMLAPSPPTPPGTPAYMAPEMMRGSLGDARSEVFAFGITLYRMFSGGRLPYGLHGRVAIQQHCPD